MCRAIVELVVVGVGPVGQPVPEVVGVLFVGSLSSLGPQTSFCCFQLQPAALSVVV